MKRIILIVISLLCFLSYGNAEKLKVSSFLFGEDSCSYFPYDAIINQTGDFITVGQRKHNYSQAKRGFINIISKLGVTKSVYIDKNATNAINVQVNSDTIICDFVNSRSTYILFDTIRRVYFDKDLHVIKEDTSYNNKARGIWKSLITYNDTLINLATDNTELFLSYYDSKLNNIKAVKLESKDTTDSHFSFLSVLAEGVAFRGSSHFYIADFQGNIIKKGNLDISAIELKRLSTGNYILSGIDFNTLVPYIEEFNSDLKLFKTNTIATTTNSFELYDGGEYYILGSAKERSLNNPNQDRALIYVNKADFSFEEKIMEFHPTKKGIYGANYVKFLKDNNDLYACGFSGDSLVYTSIIVNPNSVDSDELAEQIGAYYDNFNNNLKILNNTQISATLDVNIYSITGELVYTAYNLVVSENNSQSLNPQLSPGVYFIQLKANNNEIKYLKIIVTK